VNVLQLCKFYAPITGGMETVVLELVQGMTRLGLKVDVLCSGSERLTRHERSAQGISITRAGTWGTFLSTSMAPALVTQAMRLLPHYDLVHVHMPDPMAALALWAARPRAKLVVHWHSDVVRQRRAMYLYRPLQEWLLNRADAIIATSLDYANSSPALRFRKDKTIIIPIGISDNRETEQPELVRRIQERFGGREIVLSLGRMTYYKGFNALIDAAALLPKSCVIVVGGDGDLLARHQADVRRRALGDRICFVGRIPENELSSYFAASSMFCLASTHRAEAYGVVLLEAMAMGKPVITTRVVGSGMSWINQDEVTGLSVPILDAGAISRAVNRISSDRAWAARLGSAARERFERYLTADTMVHETVALYRRLLSPRQTTKEPSESGET
jgi:glycosyltransferase involved in cell wall biosynthesis